MVCKNNFSSILKGSAMSMYRPPSHNMPNKRHSSG